MKIIVIAVLCGVLAGCSQTSTPADLAAAGNASPAQPRKTAAAKADRCEEAIKGQANSAMLGSALGMAGGLAGFGGRGGMVAAQVASTAGGMIARSQAQQAQAAVMRECSQPSRY